MPKDIIFEHHGWSLAANVPENCECGWTNEAGLVISLHRLGLDKSLRNKITDLESVRDHYRSAFAKQGIGLVECDLLELEGIPAARAIGKMLRKPSGAAYAATIALPLPKESYVFNVAARESGITGMRETAFMLKMVNDFEKEGFALSVSPQAKSGTAANSGEPIAWKNAQTGAVILWAQDPYDAHFNGPCLRNLSEAPEYDAMFPQHPLSRVREALKCLAAGVKFSEELKKRAQEKSGWRFW